MVFRMIVVACPGSDLSVESQRRKKNLKAHAETTGRQKEAKEAREAEIFQKVGWTVSLQHRAEEGRKGHSRRYSGKGNTRRDLGLEGIWGSWAPSHACGSH